MRTPVAGRCALLMLLAVGGIRPEFAGAATFPEPPKPEPPKPAPPAPAPEPPKPPRYSPLPTVRKTKVAKPLDPWIRVQAGVTTGSYALTQTPLTETGTLYPKTFHIEGDTLGGSVRARAFAPMFRYLGIDLAYTGAGYTFDPAALCAGIDQSCGGTGSASGSLSEWSVLGVGRYVVPKGPIRPWGGLVLGGSRSVLTAFAVRGGQEIAITAFPIAALAVGGAAGAETEWKVFATFDLVGHLAGGTVPYMTEARLEVGYAPLKYAELSVTGTWWSRTSDILNADGTTVGRIEDNAIAVTFQAGGRL